MHNACNPDLAHHTTHRTKPAPDPHQPTLRRMCHLYSAGLPPQCLVKLQFRYRLCIDTRIVQQSLTPSTILRCDSHARMHRKSAAVPHPCIAATVALLSNPRRSNSPSTRCRTSTCTRSTQASSACAPRKASPCRPGATTHSSMHKCNRKCALICHPI